MKWKKNVRIIEKQGIVILCLGKNSCTVSESDIYLVNAMKNGIHEEENLKEMIMKHDNANEAVAGFTLAKFILDYQNYLEKDKGYYEITL